MELTPEDPVNEKFETIGMESKYFINNMGSFFLALMFDIFLILLWLMLMPVEKISKFVRKKNRNLGNKLFWNSWIATIIQSFLNVTLCALITFKHKFILNGAIGENV